MGYETISIQQGVLKSQSEYASPGRYIDMDKVRFDEGLPQKIGGWTATGWQTVTGTPRKAHAWGSQSFNQFVAVATECLFQVFDNDGDNLEDVTPTRDTGTLGANPFDTTSGSAVVEVTHTSHGLEQDDFLTYTGATAVGGITIDGTYQVTEVIDANTYTITHTSAATSTATGGGSSVDYEYLLTCGELNTVAGGGFGVGPFGEGTFGSERTGGNYLQFATRWSIDSYGEDLVAQRNSQTKVYYWDASAGGRMTALSNSPNGNFVFVTSERVVVSLGTDGNPMRIRGSDDADPNDWTPAITNKSFNRVLQSGSRLIAGSVLSEGVNMLWSDTSAYVMQFQGNNTTVYSTRVIGKGGDFGLIGSAAFTVVGGVAFWMSPSDFKMFAGSPSRMPKTDEIRNFVFNDLNITQSQKIECRYDPANNEVWWHYPSAASEENDRYVMFSLDEGVWCNGTMERSCFVTQTEQANTIIGFKIDGVSYEHEVGVDDAGAAMRWLLETGYSDIANGNESMDVFGFIPDFERHTGSIDLTLFSKDKPIDAALTETFAEVIAENQGIVDTRMSGRQIKFKMESEVVGGDFRLGRLRIDVQPSGSRR